MLEQAYMAVVCLGRSVRLGVTTRGGLRIVAPLE
jgi:hypothetical protein